jgi:glyoxylate/hydroxypyruvate reductase A
MKIAIHINGGRPDSWLAALPEALRAAGLGADVSVWAPGDAQADFAISWSPSPAFMAEQAAGLQALFSVGAGVDHILGVPGLPDSLPIIRVEDAGMGAQMAHYVSWAALRHLYGFDTLQAAQRERRWTSRLFAEADRCTVGVLGMGVLGEQVAATLDGLGFAVRGFSRSARDPQAYIPGVQHMDASHGLDAFLDGLNMLVLLAPLTRETQDLITLAVLRRTARPSYLINVARGALVVDSDLLAALDEGTLAGATLDVFRTEPLPESHPFWTHPKITVTPHISAKTVVSTSATQIAGKIAALTRGEAVSGVVDRSRGY